MSSQLLFSSAADFSSLVLFHPYIDFLVFFQVYKTLLSFVIVIFTFYMFVFCVYCLYRKKHLPTKSLLEFLPIPFLQLYILDMCLWLNLLIYLNCSTIFLSYDFSKHVILFIRDLNVMSQLLGTKNGQANFPLAPCVLLCSALPMISIDNGNLRLLSFCVWKIFIL